MHYRPSLSRTAARFLAVFRSPHAWALALALLLLVPGAARAAACPDFTVPNGNTTPSTSPMASGGQIVIDVRSCDSSGFGIGAVVGSGTTAHGQVTVDTTHDRVTYVNDGLGASTTDNFSFKDDNGQQVNVTVMIGAASSIVVSPASLPDPTFGVPYTQDLSATGGTGPYTFALDSGSGPLPGGLSLNGQTISGTPNQAGTFNVSIKATDSASASTIKSYSLNVGQPTIVVGQPASAVVNVPYSYTLSSTGGTGPYTYTLHAGSSLPPGLSLSSGGVLTGTLTTVTTYSFQVESRDSSGSPGPFTNITTLTLNVTNQPPTPGPVTATVAYGSTNNPITLNITGATATGVSVDTAASHGSAVATGTTITYTPTAGYAGPDSFTYKASNAAGPSTSAGPVTITVTGPTVVYAPANPAHGTAGATYTGTVAGASGGTAPYAYTVTPSSGSLPPGVTLNIDGTLTGVPSQSGVFSFKVTATDSTSGPMKYFATSGTVSLVIAQPSIAITPASLPSGTVGTAYTGQALSASGGTSPYSFSAPPANLPPGLQLGTDGTWSGTPTTAGDFTFTATATDALSFTGTRNYTVHVAAIAPGAPTGASATAGDTQASVSFVAPTNTGGAPITGYIVTSNNGGHIGTGTTSPIVVTGLTNGMDYTFTVVATNVAGPGPASAATSPAVTPKGAQTITFNNPPTQTFGTPLTLVASSTSGLAVTFTSNTTNVCTVSGNTVTFPASGTCTINADQGGSSAFLAASTVQRSFQVNALVPDAPAITAVTAGDGQAEVTFTAPASNGGAGIIDYTATASPGGAQAVSTSAGTITVLHLTNGTPYTFTVTARNTTGNTTSPAFGPATPKGVQTIMFNQAAVNFGAPTTLTATSNSGLPVSYTSTTSSVCTVNGAVLTAISPGSCTIDANQNAVGHPEWLPAPQVEQTFAVVVPGGAVALSSTQPAAGTGGTTYTTAFNASGGATPYTFAESGALPAGLTFDATSGSITGIPTASGTFPITVTVTDAATQTAQQNFQLTINAPGIALAPATLPQGQVGATYAVTTMSATGGSAPYTYSITTGALPSGLTMSPAGVISGTPTSAGSFNITVTATDKFNFQGARAYTLATGQPVPITVNYAATVNANGSVSMPVTTVDTGPFTSLAITQQPAHGTATVNGLNIVYTPAHDYFGTDTLKYTATGPGGTSAPATVTVTVTAGTVPVATAQAATVLAGKSVTIHAATGATNGPFTALTLTGMPATGTATVSGTDIVYTADPNASGVVGIDFTLSNAFGASQPAHVAVTVNARPVAQNLTASLIAGTTVKVDLTTTAHGGPFTDAKLVSISPANAGSASVQPSANGGYTLSFTAAPTFGGLAQVSYTLSNAFATSDPASIAISVTARSDPSKDAEVLGVLDAQADATRRMATGQISNFQRRLESLHGSGNVSGFSNGISMSSASTLRNPDTLAGIQGAMEDQNRNYLVAPEGQPAGSRIASSATGTGAAPGDIAFWTGGAVNFGKTQPGTSDNGIDFTTSGLSVGADKQVASKLTVGVGLGYGHDMSDVGQHGSRSTVDSYNVAVYGSYQPTDATYVDAVLGYQWLNFDARRYVTDNGAMVHGSRDGKQYFGSFSVGYQHQTDDMMVTPYGRLDIARASLDSYTESGDPIFALAYQSQTVKTATATLGMLAQWTAKRDYGTWAPQLRAEFGHDMQGSSLASMRYADLLNGPLYQATLTGLSRNHTMLGAGIALATLHGWLLRAEYQNYLDNSTRDNQSILLGVEKKFGP